MLFPALLAAHLAFAADTTLLRVLSLNDFHGALEPRVYPWSGGRPVGGAAALKASFDSAAARCRCATLRLDAGDEMQGSLASNLVFGRSTVEALNAIGIDAAALGNHDLDWGVDTLRARMREARYAWLAANLVDSVTGRRPPWAEPYRLLTRGGLRIAVIGYLTPVTKTIVKAEYLAGLRFLRGKAAFAGVLDSLRAERPDLTILVAHEGAFCDSLPCRGEIIQLARELDSTEVQLIVSGHTHTLVKTTVNGIPIIQARSHGTAYASADLVRRSDGSRGWVTNVETVWADRVTPDSAVLALVARYRTVVDRLARQVVATLRDSLFQRPREPAAGDLIADAQRAALPGTHAALMNPGGVRRELYPGTLTYNDLFELQPFGNAIVRVRLSGAALKEVLEFVLRGGRPAGYVSGLVVRYDPRRPAGERVVELLLRDGTPVEPERTYLLALSDFLQGGGDGFAMLRLLPFERTGKTDLEALVDYLRKLPQPVAAPRDVRFIAVPE